MVIRNDIASFHFFQLLSSKRRFNEIFKTTIEPAYFGYRAVPSHTVPYFDIEKQP
jgi:hypothetical protein